MSTAIDHLEQAAQYAANAEERHPGLHVLMVLEPHGLVVTVRALGRQYARAVGWTGLQDAKVNQVICAIDSALDAWMSRK